MKKVSRAIFLLLLVNIAGCDFDRVGAMCADHIAPTDLGSFELDQNGLAYDAATGLSWFRCAAGQRHTANGCVGEPTLLRWSEVDGYLAELREVSGINWRLPKYSELESIMRDDCVWPAMNVNVFRNLMIENYWAKGEGINARKACMVYNMNGARSCRLIQDNPLPLLMIKAP